MSLIEKALRQAQDPLLKSAAAPAAASGAKMAEAPTGVHSWPAALPDTQAPAPSDSSVTPALMAVAAVVLVATILLIVGGTLWINRTLRQPAPQAAAPSAEPAVFEIPVVPSALPESAPTSSDRPSAAPHLTGTIEGNGAPYAMLSSGAIAGIGETIGEGWTITGIAGGTVTVRRSDGEERTLQVLR